uniref:Transmembrane protein 19 n=1 Tax=Graphocephala atropunctata TaxID=36148 RepID=A0A1B6MIJ3_9HEMI
MISERHRSMAMTALPLVLLLISIPLSLVLWLGNMAFTAFWQGENEAVAPTRWLFSVLTPICFASYGLKKKSLSVSGALLGLLIGFVLTLSSYLFLVCLMTFFVTSSRATKFRSKLKSKFEDEFKEGGQRNWVQVLCNSGMALQLALLYILDSGCGERTIDFYNDYRASWLSLGILGVFACCNGDTWASELGTVVGNSSPFLVTTGRRVPRGTNGGVSPAGLLFSLLGGLVIGAAYYVALCYLVDTTQLAHSPAQWPVILWGAFAGLVGSLVDSFLGATIQFSGELQEVNNACLTSYQQIKV